MSQIARLTSHTNTASTKIVWVLCP
jgi:hypothetical protein